MVAQYTPLMVALVSALGGAASCHLVFETGQPNVDVWFVTDEIRNDANGQPIVGRLVTDLTGWQIDYTVDGNPAQPANIDVRTGRVWFERIADDSPYAITVKAPAQVPMIFYGVAARHYEATTHYGRLDAEAQIMAQKITLPAALPNTSIMVATTGTYASINSATCGTTCDWRLATPFEQPQLPDAAFGDRVYGLLHSEIDGKSVVTASSVQSWQLTRRAEVLIPPTASASLQTLTTPPTIVQLCGLLEGLAPQQVNRLAAWQIMAVPNLHDANGQEVIVPPRGYPLALYPTITKFLTGCVDSTKNEITFGNPFPGTMPVLATGVGVLYSFFVPGAINDAAHLAYLGASIQVHTRAEAATFPVLLDGAVPRNITVNGTAAAPEQSRIVPHADVQVAWTKSASERVDDWVIQVRRLYTDSTQFSKSELVATLRTVQTSITIPTDFLPPGDYVLSIEGRLGYPGAATQDYRQRSYPFWSATALVARIVIQ